MSKVRPARSPARIGPATAIARTASATRTAGSSMSDLVRDQEENTTTRIVLISQRDVNQILFEQSTRSRLFSCQGSRLPNRRRFRASQVRSGRALLKDRAYADLKVLIQSGEFPPNTFLSERQLVARLGMSKTPIRSALEHLEAQGLVVVSPQQGIVVTDLSVREITDLFDVRSAIEPFVAARLAERHVGMRVSRGSTRTCFARRTRPPPAMPWPRLASTSRSTPCLRSCSTIERS